MSKVVTEVIDFAAGAALIVVGVLTANPFLIMAGSGLILQGIGTMLSKGPVSGFASAIRNPIAPWEVLYGRNRVGGTIVFVNSFGENDKYLDLVMVLACHPCQSVDALYFDGQRVQIGNPQGVTPYGWYGNTFTPLKPAVYIQSISRTGATVTVQLQGDIPLLQNGDEVLVENNHPVNNLFNGKYAVQIISRIAGNLTFTYLAGGPQVTVLAGSNAGDVVPQWGDYGKKVYMEVMLGNQPVGATFQGLINGTPYDGGSNPTEVQNSNNPWTTYCSLAGKTAVHLRLHYNDTYFSNGLPQIAFDVHGKNDIFDPRSSTYGYSENAALCIADYLNQGDLTDGRNRIPWGFKAAYGTEIPSAALISAANVCDEQVALAVPAISPPLTEARYTCNGRFPVTMKRGEVLQNLLTSCAGRITYTGGQFVIWPAAWYGITGTIGQAGSPPTDQILAISAGPFRWRSTVSISALYNGVKGTYISPVNKWQASDFPRYCQDVHHGYNWGSSPQFDQNLDNDGGDRRWLDIQLPFTISSATAQRIAKVELLRRRNMGTGTFLLNMTGYQYAPMDVLQVDLNFFGWGGKYLEVLASRLKFDKSGESGDETVLLGVEIDVQETDPSIYTWFVDEELSPQGYQQADLPDTKTPAPPTNFVGWSEFGDIFLTWDPPNDGYVLNGGHIEIEYQKVESPEGLWHSLAKMEPTITKATIVGLTAGDQYVCQIRSVNAAGVPSVWVEASPIDTSPLTPGPITVQGGGPPEEWGPFAVQAPATDALFPNEWNFTAEIVYGTDSSGAPTASAQAAGALTVNSFLTGCPSPTLSSDVSNVIVSPTGGFIPGGTTLYVAVCAYKSSSNKLSPPSNVLSIPIPAGTNTNSVQLFSIQWPDFNGLDTYFLFASTDQNLICMQESGGLAFASPPDFYVPDALAITGPLARMTWALPNPNFSDVKLKVKECVHAGVLGAPVIGVTGNQIVATATIDPSGNDNWGPPVIQTSPPTLGRVLMIIGRENAQVPFLSFRIDAFDPNTGTFTLDQDAEAAGVLAGDTFVVCFQGYNNAVIMSGSCEVNGTTVVYDTGDHFTDQMVGQIIDIAGSMYTILDVITGAGQLTIDTDAGIQHSAGWVCSFTPTIITDPGLINAESPLPRSGLIINGEVGYVIRVIAGTSRGARSKVVANGDRWWQVADPIILDGTSVWIVEDAAWKYFAESTQVPNSDYLKQTKLAVDVRNYVRETVVLGGFTVDVAGEEADDGDAPIRLAWVSGSGGIQLDVPYGWNVWDSTTGAAFQPTAVRKDCSPFEFVITILSSPATDCQIDIQCTRAYDPTQSAAPTPFSIFNAPPITIPAGTTGQLVFDDTVFWSGVPTAAQLDSAATSNGSPAPLTISQWNWILQNVVPVNQGGGQSALIVTSATAYGDSAITAAQYQSLLLQLHPLGVILYGPSTAGGYSDTLVMVLVSGDGSGTFHPQLLCALEAVTPQSDSTSGQQSNSQPLR